MAGQGQKGFNFFGQSGNTGGFNFGTAANTTTTPASGGFNFGTGATTATTQASGGFNFGTHVSTTTTPASGGFNFGTATNTAAAPASGGFNFSSQAGSLGFNTSTTDVSSGGFNLSQSAGFNVPKTTGMALSQTSGSTGLQPTGITQPQSTGLTGLQSTGFTQPQSTDLTTGFTHPQPTGSTGLQPTGFTQPQSTGLTGLQPTGYMLSHSTNVTGSLPTAQGSAFSFGTPVTTQSTATTTVTTTTGVTTGAGTGGFSFGTATTQQAGNTGGVNMGGKPTTTGTPFSFGIGGAAVGTTVAAALAPTSTLPGGFNLGTSNNTPSTTSSSLASLLGAPPSTQPTIGASATTQTPSTTGFTLGSGLGNLTSASSTSSFSFGTATTAASASNVPGFFLGTGAPKLGTTTASATTASGLALGQTITSGLAASSATASTTTTTTATLASAIAKPASRQMTYKQLEEETNKWMTELEEQERNFLLQATQVNAWDRLVIENGEKIVQLNSDLERVKLEQQKLDHELDFVHSQQRELGELLTPLETALDAMPPISYQQHADLEREHTYQLAESLDAQLKRMGQDLREIIERLNHSSTKPDPDDPVQQITKILNAHMDSLLWVDRQTSNLNRRVEEMSRLMESEKKEQERNFRLAYS